MKRRWLRWIGLFLLIEGCLYLFGACRPCFDYQGNQNRSLPLLILTRDEKIIVYWNGEETAFLIDDDLTKALESYILRQNASQASRTKAGQLLDSHGRVLL